MGAGWVAIALWLADAEALAHYRQASQAFVERRFETTIAELRKSLAIDPKQLGATRLLGLSYQLTNELQRAEEAFQQAVRLAPNDAESWFYLGRVHYVQNFFDKALRALNRAVRFAPHDPRIRECLALTLEADGDTLGAHREYERAIRFAPENQVGPAATPYLNYGAFLSKLGRIEESERLLIHAVKAMPESWQAHFELGKLYYQTDRFELAQKQLRAALACDRREEEARRIHGLLAMTYARLGREEEARTAYAAAQR